MEVRTLGPHNFHDFPLWLLMPDKEELFYRNKTEMENYGPKWKTATHWRSARGESENYRVQQFGQCFYPQEEIVGEWNHLHDFAFKPFRSLDEAKAHIAESIRLTTQYDKRALIHDYP